MFCGVLNVCIVWGKAPALRQLSKLGSTRPWLRLTRLHYKTKCMPILLYGLDACPVSPRQLRSFNHVVVSCGRKMFNLNTSEIAAECLKMFGVCDVAEAVATRKDRFVKRYVLSSSVVCEICFICS